MDNVVTDTTQGAHWADVLRARHLVSIGDAAEAEALAMRLLDAGLEEGDFRLQGEAMHILAVGDLRLLGRFERALELSERSTICFERVRHEEGECAALATHCIAAVRLGRFERAMDSALMSVRLADALNIMRKRVLAYQALGIAAYCGRNFDESRNAFQRAIQCAHQCDPPANVFELHVDLSFAEILHYFTERNLGGTRLTLDGVRRHVQEAKRLLMLDGGNISLSPGSHANNLLVLHMGELLLRIWDGDIEVAREGLAEYRTAAMLNGRPWMLATEHWGAAEIALIEGNLELAKTCAGQMLVVAERHRHETLTGIAWQLTSYVCQRAGDHVGALHALQRLLRQEQDARAEGLKSRVNVIQWQLDLRQNQQRVQHLESASRLFEKLAMEDALTGLANRRALETRLGEWLADQQDEKPLFAALIDVDRFKQINDEYSHHAGDEVLKALAAIFRRNVRDGDMCARLGGDEFVLILRGLAREHVEEIHRRIDADVAAWDGSAVAAGLKVGISFGFAPAEPNDTVDALLARADSGMYRDKAKGRVANSE
jgi:diguanylate cyclase